MCKNFARLVVMEKPPQIKLKIIKPQPEGKPFINVERNLCSLEYPNGTKRQMVIDSVTRSNPDAVVILPWCLIDKEPHLWLRSSIRPAAAIRAINDKDFAKNIGDGNLWELPAGIIDPGETPRQAAKRECQEEVGFDKPENEFIYMNTILSMPALLAERLYFYYVQVYNADKKEPLLDGSPLEEGGELICVSVQDLLEDVKEGGAIIDIKTNLGIRMLRDRLVLDGWYVY